MNVICMNTTLLNNFVSKPSILCFHLWNPVITPVGGQGIVSCCCEGPWYGGMPENGTSSNWLKNIIVILFFVGLQLVYFINESKSMVDLNFNLVKMEPNRVVELSVVNQSLLGQLCLIISADNKFKSINMIYVVTKRQEVQSTATNLINLDLDLKLVNERLVVLDLIPLELGNSNRIRMVWKPGLGEQSTRRHRKEEKHIKLKDRKTEAKQVGGKATKKERRQIDSRKQFGPEYSSDNAGDGPVGKTVGKRSRGKTINKQDKKNWHEMEAKRVGQPPGRQVNELTLIETIAEFPKEEIIPAMRDYLMLRLSLRKRS